MRMRRAPATAVRNDLLFLKNNPKRAAPGFSRCHFNTSIHGIDKSMSNEEAQPRRRFMMSRLTVQRGKFLKQLVYLLLPDARALIVYLYNMLVSR